MDLTVHSGCAAAGAAVLLLIIVMMIMYSRTAGKKIRQGSCADPVSGSITELYFIERGRRVLSGKFRQFALISVRACAMPRIRRLYGPTECDRILRCICDVLKTRLGSDELIARTGEDSFCFLLKNRRPEEISAKLEAISAAFRNAVGSDALFPDPVFGVYLPDTEQEDLRVMLQKAAMARPDAPSDKRCGFFSADMLRTAERERELAESVGTAIERGELTVYLQPKVRVSDQRVAGAEALVRWRHPRLGLLSPEMFLPAAENYQTVTLIDRFVLKEVCRFQDIRSRNEEEPCPISVNLSRMSMQSADWPVFCAELCRRYGVSPSLIEFEMRESLLMENPERASSLIEQLHADGFRCVMDNYGSDASSLQLLGSLDVDAIKLDRSFFSGANNSRHGRFLIETILRLAAQMHIHTIALGIDNPGQVQYLQQAACDFIQGFHYYKPMPVDRFEQEVCDEGTLCYVTAPTASRGDGKKSDSLSLTPTAQTSGSIIHLIYRPGEDTIEFSAPISPIVGDATEFENAMALFRTADIIHANDRKDFFQLLERCQRESGWVSNTLRFHTAPGRYEWLELRLHQDSRSIEKTVNGILVNMSDWKNEVNRWKEKATRDALTGLYNREYFENTVSSMLSRATFSTAALLFVDVDFFKQVNDTYGHMVGDDVLCYIAKQLLGIFRHTDIIARYGGDEFVVFAPAIERTILVERLERLYGTFKYPYRNDNVNCHISTSIGAAIFPGDGDNYETILDHADCALYEAKKNGRSQYVLYEPHMQGNSGKNEPAGEEEVR